MQYAALVEANERYEELLLETPEAYPFPWETMMAKDSMKYEKIAFGGLFILRILINAG